MVGKKKAPAGGRVKNLPFRGAYIALPAAIFLLSVVLAAYFYGMLPSEVAYHFAGDIPDRWLGRGAIIAWLIIPQFAFALFAFVTILIATMMSRQMKLATDTPVGELLSIMGNMVVLPQLVLAFAMLDIFLYNSYQIRLMPVWVFALMVMAVGGIVLGLLFIRAIRRLRGYRAEVTRK
jgi:hypothetical protein